MCTCTHRRLWSGNCWNKNVIQLRIKNELFSLHFTLQDLSISDKWSLAKICVGTSRSIRYHRQELIIYLLSTRWHVATWDLFIFFCMYVCMYVYSTKESTQCKWNEIEKIPLFLSLFLLFQLTLISKVICKDFFSYAHMYVHINVCISTETHTYICTYLSPQPPFQIGKFVFDWNLASAIPAKRNVRTRGKRNTFLPNP